MSNCGSAEPSMASAESTATNETGPRMLTETVPSNCAGRSNVVVVMVAMMFQMAVEEVPRTRMDDDGWCLVQLTRNAKAVLQTKMDKTENGHRRQ